MNKALPLALVMCIAATSPMYADTINGIDFEIPEEWELIQSDEDESILTNYYSFSDEVVAIMVQDLSTIADADKTLSNIYVLNCDEVYGEKDGYYLMTDERQEIDGLANVAQECVFNNSGEWKYVYLASKSFGDHIETIVYQSPTTSYREAFPHFGQLYIDHFMNG